MRGQLGDGKEGGGGGGEAIMLEGPRADKGGEGKEGEGRREGGEEGGDKGG